MEYKSVVEGILFIVGDEGTTIKEISETLNITESEVKEILTEKWYTLVPFAFLLVIILLRSLKIVDIVPLLLNQIVIGGEPFLKAIDKIFGISLFHLW